MDSMDHPFPVIQAAWLTLCPHLCSYKKNIVMIKKSVILRAGVRKHLAGGKAKR